jgi:hypothetical protein
MMKIVNASPRRRPLGRVSVDTKGPPGIYMEASGRWDRHGLN